MDSLKANAIANWAATNSIEMIRFDYSGLGKSSGDFSTANLSHWLEEALSIYRLIQNHPTVIVGSSMGAWLALRLTEILYSSNKTMPKSLLLLAPAIDFTHEVLLKALPDNLLQQLQLNDKITIPSQYDLEALIFYPQFIEDAEQHRLLNRPANINTPITIIHGKQDRDIPFEHGERTANHFPNTRMIAIDDAEHRLSRDSDIHLILNTLKSLLK